MLRSVVGSMAVLAMIMGVAVATNHTVGGSGGWDTTTNLNGWAKSQKFAVGDNLIFQYGGSHDVMEVSKSDYDACKSSKPMVSDNSGMTVVQLSKPGNRYFICGTPGHCSNGMKLAVNVIAASTTPTPTPASSPVASGPASSSDELPQQPELMPPAGSPFAGSPNALSQPSSPSSASSRAVDLLALLVIVGAAILHA